MLLGAASDSLMPSLEIVQAAIEKSPDALILTHIGGYPNPQISEIANLCNKKNVLLIEDCAHSPLVKINNKYVGTYGDAGILSFYEPEKEILPSDGLLVIFPADTYHSSVYNGNKDRVIVGVNFYCF